MSEHVMRDMPSDKRTVQISTAEDRQREQYGGFNIGAAFFGWLVATAIAILLMAIVAAITGSTAASQNINADSLNQADTAQTAGIISAIVLLIVMAIAYYAGGYVAGRMSRFDGGRQGFGVWVFSIIVTIILAIVGAILGAKFNILSQLNLPAIPISGDQATTGGILALVISLIVTAAAAISGGKVGERYHHKVDRAAARNEG